MSEQTKSLIRHILTALGFVLGIVGLNKFTGVLNILLNNLDGLSAAITTIIGVVVAIIGFFKDKVRFALRASVKNDQ